MIGGLKKTSVYLLASVGAFGVLASSGTAAKATDTAALEAQMRAMQAQMKALQQQVNEAKAQAAASHGSSGDGLDLKVKWKGAPELSSSDGKFKFKVRGRVMTDYDGIDQDTNITGKDDVSAVELRRARLGVEGVVFYDWKYKFEVDFAGNGAAIKDAFVSYANWAPWEESEIRFGNQYVYNSIEQLTSSRFITFMERAAFEDAFFLERQIGVGLLAGNDHWSFQTGYYGAEPGEQGDFFSDNTAFSVRGTVAPINNDTTVVHLGASYRHRDAGTLRDNGTGVSAAELFEYRAKGADLHLADRFVATPEIGESDDMFVLEGALVFKSLSFQGEYAQLQADVPPGFGTNATPTYNGYYVDASWFITGEMRNYEAKTGEFGRTKVLHPVYGGSHGWGAWQIAGRYDVINLGDKSEVLNNAGIDCSKCGDQATWLIGLNWLLTDYTALKLQVSQSEISGGVNDGAKITGVGLRAQVDW
jgi:phosphate-selective porin OprO and OprP